MRKYDFRKIERKWQKKWLAQKTFRAKDFSKKPKWYQLETFPYPSAAGLHVGHPKGYIAEDIQARYHRMKGYEVLYTMGWDAFGLPTENYALKVGKTPKEVAKENIKNFKRQVQMFGLSYDWDREINTSSPEYYKWTQWLFIQLYKKGLAYRAKAKVNWCPKDQTVLANEQVVNGHCERCDTLVVQKEMEQWFLKITKYTDELLRGLEGLDWPAATIKRQEDWIGKSEGALISFKLQGSGVKEEKKIEVFTTRPDTLFGATYLVLAPEHPIVISLKPQIKNWKEVKKYVEATKRKTELMRLQEGDPSTGSGQGKTGVPLKGVEVVNPANNKKIPVWIADYVLGSYGTGAIMAVPAHDERDFEFAKKFKLKSVPVVLPTYVGTGTKTWMSENGVAEEENILNNIAKSVESRRSPYLNRGSLFNSGQFSGLTSDEAMWKIVKFVGGKRKTQYRLRDWSVSRQRYWGAPIPMIHCNTCALRDPSGQGIQPVPEKDLPVKLPDDVDYRPKGLPPLATSKKFMNVRCPKCKGKATRDPETLDTFVDSSWYYLRYTDPKNKSKPFDKLRVNYWLPTNLYVIGAEHTVLHLLYSRFITKFLRDEGLLSFSEPFQKLRHQGLIQGSDGHKMSKSKGNVVNPDPIVAEFGADALRLYEMFMGPFDEGQPWDDRGVVGAERFLMRFWAYCTTVLQTPNFKKVRTDATVKSFLARTAKKVEDDIEEFKFNTAISALMVFLNAVTKEGEYDLLEKKDLEALVKLLNPFAPHMASELWSALHNTTPIDYASWPTYDAKFLVEETFTLVIQVNGRVRGSLELPRGVTKEDAEKLALGDARVRSSIGETKPKKVIFIPNRLINFVI